MPIPCARVSSAVGLVAARARKRPERLEFPGLAPDRRPDGIRIHGQCRDTENRSADRPGRWLGRMASDTESMSTGVVDGAGEFAGRLATCRLRVRARGRGAAENRLSQPRWRTDLAPPGQPAG